MSAMREADGIEVRASSAGDDARIVEIWRSCDLLRPWNDPHADIALARASASSELLVGFEPGGGDAVAAVMAGFDGHRGWIYYLAVDPSCRGRGYGAAMVRAAEHWLAGVGAGKVNLMIRAENTGVRAFYEHTGYEVEERVVMARRIADAT